MNINPGFQSSKLSVSTDGKKLPTSLAKSEAFIRLLYYFLYIEAKGTVYRIRSQGQ